MANKLLLQAEKFDDELAERIPIPGIATGLAWTTSGSGNILFIEVSMAAGKGNLQLTGTSNQFVTKALRPFPSTF
jgi:ATP-dependent Lon protease